MKILTINWTTNRDLNRPQKGVALLLIAVLATAVSAKEMLTSADISYAGCFRIPKNLSEEGEIQIPKGLAHRYVGSELRFFMNSHNGPVFEFKAPESLSQNIADAPAATEVDNWPGLSVGHAYPEGLFWDSVDARLYFAGGHWYNTTWPHDPSVGFADSDKQVRGAWAFGDAASGSERSSKTLQGGVLHIPKWFSDLYCPGKRLGAGFGGYYSILSLGPVSLGPALTAFDPADMGVSPYVSESQMGISHTPLLGYDPGHRAYRDTDYNSEFDGGDFNPENGVGYWTWADYIHQGGEWIDMPGKSGVLFFANMGNGRVWYESSDLNGERGSHHVFFYDPEDLAAVAQGLKNQYEIQPVEDWKIEFPGISYPLSEWRGPQQKSIKGVTFDPISKRLYIALPTPEDDINWMDNPPVIFVYDVHDEGASARKRTGESLDFSLEVTTTPFNSLVYISLSGMRSDFGRKMHLEVLNAMGKILVDVSPQLKNGTALWDAAGVPGGTYWVRAASGTAVVSKAFSLLK